MNFILHFASEFVFQYMCMLRDKLLSIRNRNVNGYFNLIHSIHNLTRVNIDIHDAIIAISILVYVFIDACLWLNCIFAPMKFNRQIDWYDFRKIAYASKSAYVSKRIANTYRLWSIWFTVCIFAHYECRLLILLLTNWHSTCSFQLFLFHCCCCCCLLLL